MYLARKHTDMSFPEIGRFMGNKNHSTVILANRRIEQSLAADETAKRQTPAGQQEEQLRDIVTKIERQLGKACSAETTVPASVHFPEPLPVDRAGVSLALTGNRAVG
jgi:hypothetical protein